MSFVVNRRDLDFVLFEMLETERLTSRPRFANYDRASITQILDTAQTLAEDVFLPIAAEVDADEPKFIDGRITQPAATGRALQAYADAGFFGLSFDEELGGLQALWVVNIAATGMIVAANTPVSNYAFLTIAAANLLNTFGTAQLKARYLPPMIEGRWFGTMCLSETQAGSSLGDIRTLATPIGDGRYSLKGTKMWISGGDQAITDNIVHMVLAKLPDAPAGSKGISLFLVPKNHTDAEGRVIGSNNIALAGLNHKLGQRATTNCLLNFGEGGPTTGWLIGEAGRGLEYMFHMMNEARIGVGHAAVMAGLAGYLYSADYAKNRLQGRSAKSRDLSLPQVAIIEHADIRRMLLQQKAAVEGGLALCLYASSLVDDIATAPTPQMRAKAQALLGLLTPVVKSWPSEHCLEANKWAIQILGGYGYTRDYPLERLYRDNRLNHIHEGTFGIQALDLLGRKIGGDQARTLGVFLDKVQTEIDHAATLAELAPDALQLSQALEVLSRTTTTLLNCLDADARTANATLFLDAFGHVVIGWIWLWQARLAEAKLAQPTLPQEERRFYLGKRIACHHFAHHELPLAITRLQICESLQAPALDCAPEIFGL